MKTFLAIGTLAAFCQSALGLNPGAYTIGSAALQDSQVLSEIDDANGPLVFSTKNNDSNQVWFFNPTGTYREFLIQSQNGGYINCGTIPGSPCFSGDEPEIYIVEQVTSHGYELVAKQTGYFLRADGQNLKIAEYDGGQPDEEFILTSIQ
ncbi:hypothetical protein BDV36DRAFT_300270 [Aspergillus pseudocaelatus]|uniref:Ricin B lectin domain-containing protein n=1 Tax=Aspergillus pseudocaelatus TaxID=1825620 RepID=A0ABQ6W7N7_9EURO|nr:hypothetical protein BDV36DRAFT_300270 [Aspergillus pseudocaelatus]